MSGRLSAKELAAELGVTPRTVRNWGKLSPPVPCVVDKGRKYYELAAVVAWRDSGESEARGGDGQAVSVPATKATARTVAAVQSTASTTAGPAEALASLESLRARLEAAEIAMHDRFLRTARRNNAKQAEVTKAQRDWADLVDERRKLEGQFTKIVAERGDYVPAAEAARVVTKAFAVTREQLDRLGQIVGKRVVSFIEGAERSVTAADVEAEIDAECQLLVGRMRSALLEIMEGGE